MSCACLLIYLHVAVLHHLSVWMNLHWVTTGKNFRDILFIKKTLYNTDRRSKSYKIQPIIIFENCYFLLTYNIKLLYYCYRYKNINIALVWFSAIFSHCIILVQPLPTNATECIGIPKFTVIPPVTIVAIIMFIHHSMTTLNKTE